MFEPFSKEQIQSDSSQMGLSSANRVKPFFFPVWTFCVFSCRLLASSFRCLHCWRALVFRVAASNAPSPPPCPHMLLWCTKQFVSVTADSCPRCCSEVPSPRLDALACFVASASMWKAFDPRGGSTRRLGRVTRFKKTTKVWGSGCAFLTVQLQLHLSFYGKRRKRFQKPATVKKRTLGQLKKMLFFFLFFFF